MSIEAMVWVLNHSRSRSTDRLVLLVLANYASDDGEAWPAQRTLARRAAVSTHTVYEALGRLVDLGEIELLQPGGPRRSARYRFPMGRAVDNLQSNDADMRHGGQNSGADTRRSDADTRRSVAQGAPDPSLPHTQKDLRVRASSGGDSESCSSCGWQPTQHTFKGHVDDRGLTHPQRHSEAMALITEGLPSSSRAMHPATTTKGKPQLRVVRDSDTPTTSPTCENSDND